MPITSLFMAPQLSVQCSPMTTIRMVIHSRGRRQPSFPLTEICMDFHAHLIRRITRNMYLILTTPEPIASPTKSATVSEPARRRLFIFWYYPELDQLFTFLTRVVVRRIRVTRDYSNQTAEHSSLRGKWESPQGRLPAILSICLPAESRTSLNPI